MEKTPNTHIRLFGNLHTLRRERGLPLSPISGYLLREPQGLR